MAGHWEHFPHEADVGIRGFGATLAEAFEQAALAMSATAKLGAIPHEDKGRSVGWAALACMGVVFGDIGTSPLYTLNTAAKAASPDGQITPEAVLGIVSLIFWSLIVVISLKYATLIMRADNHGEGGILALLALVSPRRVKQNRRRAALLVVGLIGATLLYGDGTITPAISVLSAIEGLKIYAPQMEHFVVPLTVVILAGLFIIQRNGTSWLGGIFGPVMLIWFIIAGVLGIGGIVLGFAIQAVALGFSSVALVEPIVSTLVDEDACRGCGLCAALCPYGALEIVRGEKGRKVKVIPVACKGCGVCAATCYQHALSVNSYTDEQIGDQMKAFLDESA